MMNRQHRCVFLYFVPYVVAVILFFPERRTASQVCSAVTSCEKHVRMLWSEAERSEAEPAAILPMSGHMVGILVW